ncbi:MAG TPA: glycosyl hydrolase [Solirubrobacteraceae bacterium]
MTLFNRVRGPGHAITAVLILTALVLAAAMSAPARVRHKTAPVSADPLASGSHVALGVNLPDGPSVPELNTFTQLVGKRPRVVMWYQDWNQRLIARRALGGLARAGALPLITWDPQVNGVGVPLRAIAQGSYDRYLRRSAAAARRWRGIIYLRFAHEMNVPSSPFGPGHVGDGAHAFKTAWRHIVRIFRANRATNVKWVFSPNVSCLGTCPFNRFYPGNRWVDWTALDGYNYAGLIGSPWRSFGDVFGSSYRRLTRLAPKPVMIAETATSALGGNKAAWILSMAAALRSKFRKVRVLVWFDRDKETDWRVESSPESLAAFRAILASGLFSFGP